MAWWPAYTATYESETIHTIIKDCQFQQSKKVLEGQAKLLRQEEKGKRPDASSTLSIPEEEALWENGKLGSSSPQVLCHTMWWILTQHFGLRGRQEHHSMNVEDFNLCRDDRVIECVTFKENPTKTRQGGLNSKWRQVLPKMFAAGGPRCPVGLFKDFLSRRPPELGESGPFYLAVIERPKTEVWYKKQRLGIHSIDQMMKNIVKSTPVALSGKKLTNHSARKTLVKRLRTANVERQSIVQVTGHASEQSLQDYDKGTKQEQQVLSSIISNNPQQPLKAKSDRSSVAVKQPRTNSEQFPELHSHIHSRLNQLSMLAQYQAVQEAQIAWHRLIHSKAFFRKKNRGLLISHFQFMNASAFEDFCSFVSYVGDVRRT